eukprot:15324998-Ditylum_brightwellii.AAC.1
MEQRLVWHNNMCRREDDRELAKEAGISQFHKYDRVANVVMVDSNVLRGQMEVSMMSSQSLFISRVAGIVSRMGSFLKAKNPSSCCVGSRSNGKCA